MSLIDPSKVFIPGETLLFFDEITEFPEIAASLKFFCLDKRFDVICSGSMLGVNYKKIESNSVGYKKDYDMFSMDVFAPGGKYHALIMCNPVTPIVNLFRYAYLGIGQIEWSYYAISWIVTLVVLLLGVVLFSRVEKTFMDTV